MSEEKKRSLEKKIDEVVFILGELNVSEVTEFTNYTNILSDYVKEYKSLIQGEGGFVSFFDHE